MTVREAPAENPALRQSRESLLGLYRSMARMRLAEEKVAELYPQQEMRCPVHLHVGQEAVSSGVCANLTREDRIFGSHRSHGPYLAFGGDLKAFYAELYGKETGCCRGRGGSMHLIDRKAGYWGSSAIVAGTIPIAVGTAVEAVYRKKKTVSVAFFGDGAVDEGVFYESLAYAGLKKLPVLFVCENNRYATNSRQGDRQALDNICQRGPVFGVAGLRVDGNDVFAVQAAAADAVRRARTGEGPTLLECDTYRWKGHVGPTDDLAQGCRSREEHAGWVARCPLRLFEDKVLSEGVLSRRDLDAVRSEIAREIEEAVAFARKSPFPDPAAVLREENV